MVSVGAQPWASPAIGRVPLSSLESCWAPLHLCVLQLSVVTPGCHKGSTHLSMCMHIQVCIQAPTLLSTFLNPMAQQRLTSYHVGYDPWHLQEQTAASGSSKSHTLPRPGAQDPSEQQCCLGAAPRIVGEMCQSTSSPSAPPLGSFLQELWWTFTPSHSSLVLSP